MFSFFGGGHGGHPEGDGLSHGNAPISMATIPPVEILEARYPVQFRQWALRNDSGGPGEFRGGLGGLYEMEFMNEATGFLFGERGKYPPQPIAGGKPGALNVFSYDVDDEHGGLSGRPPMSSKITGIRIGKNQRVRLESPGGGGCGDPRKREPQRVLADVLDGFVSIERARSDYGVVIADGAVDETATRALRETSSA